MGTKMCCAPINQLPTLGKVPKMMISHKVQNCSVALTLGHVFQEEVDSIVFVTNSKLRLGEQIANEFKKLGGPSINEELNKILLQQGGKLDFGEVVYTHAGDLDYDYIFYAVLPSFKDTLNPNNSISTGTISSSNSLVQNVKYQSNIQQLCLDQQQGDSQQQFEKQHIFECILNTLQLAEGLGLTSIAFPVMEPTNLHISKSLIATITLVAIKTFIKDSKKNTITTINISIQDVPTLHLFKWAFQQIIIEETDAPNRNSNGTQNVNSHYWGIKESSQQSQENQIQIDSEELMRFGHALHEKENSSNSELKNSI